MFEIRQNALTNGLDIIVQESNETIFSIPPFKVKIFVAKHGLDERLLQRDVFNHCQYVKGHLATAILMERPDPDADVKNLAIEALEYLRQHQLRQIKLFIDGMNSEENDYIAALLSHFGITEDEVVDAIPK